MKKFLTIWLLTLGLLAAFFCPAQRIVFRLQQPAPDKVYLAGNHNGWNPADSNSRFLADSLVLHLSAGQSLQYKLTLGSWQQGECDAGGGDIQNRQLFVNSDTTVWLQVGGWKMAAKSTASSHVQLWKQVNMLGKERSIFIYLPPDYAESQKTYPVLYALDGQNCFDARRAAFGEWHMDETLDSVFASTGKAFIIVAIDHAGEGRIAEYNMQDHRKYGAARGADFVRTMLQLKRQVDSAFRTRRERGDTWVVGSSMGGLMSAALVTEAGKVFGGAGIFSPAFWIAPDWSRRAAASLAPHTQLYFYAGGAESKEMVPEMQAFADAAKARKKVKTKVVVDAEAGHNEAAWAQQFPGFAAFLLRSVF